MEFGEGQPVPRGSGDVLRHRHVPQGRDKLAGVRAFVAAQRQAAVLWHPPGHLHRRLPLRGAGRWRDAVADEPLAAFHQDMPLVAKLGPVTVFFQNAPGLPVRRRGTGTVTTPLPTQSDGRIPGIVGRRAAHPGRALEPLEARPRFDQDTVDGEVFTGQQMLGAGPRHDVLEERAGRLAAQPSPLSGDLRGAPDRVVHGQTHEPAKEQFAINCSTRSLSLRPVYRTWTNSDGRTVWRTIDGHPLCAYSSATYGDISRATTSTKRPIARAG